MWEGNGNVVQTIMDRHKGSLEASTAEAILSMMPSVC